LALLWFRLAGCEPGIVARLFPHLGGVRVEAVSGDSGVVRIVVRTCPQAAVTCPGCGADSTWEHSRYVRHVAEVPVVGRPVVIDVSVRRMYFPNPACARVTRRGRDPAAGHRVEGS
jgi:transposase